MLFFLVEEVKSAKCENQNKLIFEEKQTERNTESGIHIFMRHLISALKNIKGARKN